MQASRYLGLKKIFLFIGFITLSAGTGWAQSVYLPYSYQLDQKFNADIYSTKTSFHTSLKPFLIDSVLAPRYNAFMKLGVDSTRKTWLSRKIFNEHLFDVKTNEYTFYGDYLPDLQTGRDIAGKKNTNLNTRGYQLGGTVGDKFSFYTSGYEDQGVFPKYFDDIINTEKFVPGQAYDRSFGKFTKDWSYATAYISYTPIKQLNITLGEDKTFIGDGYRSLLLSDYAAPSPLLRLTANLGKVQYMMMWTYLESLTANKFDGFGSNRRKWGIFHYLDWSISNSVSLGFFNAVIAAEANELGDSHGFDLNYINPILFDSSLGRSNFITDNTLIGFTGKYKFLNKNALYAQLLIDRFNNGNILSNSVNNTGGIQIGVRGADLFKVKNLNYLVEYNAVRPYTYQTKQIITSYTQYEEPLGDPLGANFRESIAMLNYSIGKFDFTGQVNYAKYGLDIPGINDGKNIDLASFQTPSTTADIGQGIPTTLYYGEGTVSYLINPRYNLRFELGGLFREEKNNLGDKKTTMITFGLRSTFRNLYHDF